MNRATFSRRAVVLALLVLALMGATMAFSQDSVPQAATLTGPTGPLSGSSATFSWTTGNLVTKYMLFVGTAPGTGDDFYSGEVTSTSLLVNGLRSTDGNIYVRLYSWFDDGWHYNDYTFTYTFPVPAALTSPTGSLSGSSATFSWTTGTLVSKYMLCVGTHVGATDNFYSGETTATTLDVSGLRSTDGNIYVRLYSWINGGWQFNDYTLAYTTPVAATLTAPAAGTTLSGKSATFTWTPGTLVSKYMLFVGTTPGGAPDNFYSGEVTATSLDVNGLRSTDGNIYVRLYSWINGGWQFKDYTFAYEAPAVPAGATLTAPAAGTVLSGKTATFTWTPGTLVSKYMLFVGTTPGGAPDNFYSGELTATSLDVNGLRSTDGNIYVRLYSWFNNGWHYNDYTFAYSSPVVPVTATLTAPTTNISGTTAQFTWTPGTGISSYMLLVGTTPGNTDLYYSGSTTSTDITVDGLRTNDGRIYVRLYSWATDHWLYNDYAFATNPGCDGTEYFCDDFQSGTSANWDLTPGTGSFSVINEPGVTGNKVLQYLAGSTTGNVIAVIKDTVWQSVKDAGHDGNYYVEARIKPLTNGTTGNKQLFMLGRYQNATNWYFGGLNVQNATTSTQVEEGYMLAGTLNRPVQSKQPIIMGTPGGTDGQWYTVRFEMNGTVMSVYLDSQKMTSTFTDTTWATGKIGLFTANKSFLIDDIRVGDASVKPVQLYLTPSALTYIAEANDPPYNVTVTALKSDLTPDTFAVQSDNPSVVTVTVNGNVVTLTPVGAGTANITFFSGANPKLKKTIIATIAPQFIQSTTVYNLDGRTIPAAGATGQYIDDKLVLTFDAPPTLNTTGSIRIFKSSDNSLVDKILMTGDTDSIGLPGTSTYSRGVNDIPVSVSGNNLIINPHQSKLAYNTSYYVAIAPGAITGTLSGLNFDGIGLASNWSFTTKAAPPTTLTTINVGASGLAADGVTPADFKTVQGALNYVMKNATASPLIKVADGTYQEMLYLRGVNNVTIQGQSRTGTIIQYNNYDGLNSGSGAGGTGSPTSNGGRAVFLVENADLLTLDTLTLKNTHLRSYLNASGAQAETIYYNSDTGRLIAKNADFYSEQDTLQLRGYNWFYNTLISGNVDFIWGSNRTTLFENSEIRMIGDSNNANPSQLYNLQARTTTGQRGFFFLNSTLTYGPGPNGNTVPTGVGYLARAAAGSWQDNVFYINCRMDTHIATLGWAAPNIGGNPNPSPSTATLDLGWREWGSKDINGNPLDLSGRSPYSSHAFDPTAKYGTRALIFSNYNNNAGWNPQP